MAKWINFVLLKEGKKTNVWEIVTKNGAETLGLIKWFPSWRKYALFPYKNTVYENDCLKDIAEFIEQQMKLRKQKGKK